jgi:hypothetical protein
MNHPVDLPVELWKEIKDYAGIYSISTDWDFSHVYDGNWIQFYLEWFRPTAEELDNLTNVNEIKQLMFTSALSFKQWSRVHLLNKKHQTVEMRHVYRSCNALLEIEPHDLKEEYDIVEFYIPFYVEQDKELRLLQSIHSLLKRCKLARLFYDYHPGHLILSVYVKENQNFTQWI